MEALFGLGFGVLLLGSVVETLLYFFATPLLGRLAFIPMGGPPVDVGPGGQEVLSGRRATHWIAALRARLHRPPTDHYPLTAAALQDMGVNASDLMAIRSGRFEGDGTRRER